MYNKRLKVRFMTLIVNILKKKLGRYYFYYFKTLTNEFPIMDDSFFEYTLSVEV